MKRRKLLIGIVFILSVLIYFLDSRSQTRAAKSKPQLPLASDNKVQGGSTNSSNSTIIQDRNRLLRSSSAAYRADADLNNPERHRDPGTRLPADFQKQLESNELVELPDDLKEQLHSSAPELTQELKSQLIAKPQPLPEDLQHQLEQPTSMTPN